LKKITEIGPLKELIRESKYTQKRIGFVPTMGYLHEGHLSLVDLARQKSDIVVMSIFVNPTQFGPGEDYDQYPRDMELDSKLAKDRGVDIIFCPEVDVIYPDGDTLAYIDMLRLPDFLCGARRPDHFRGVMTVVAKLFNLVEPDVAVFGRKDIQQFIIIERMVRDLDFPVEMLEGSTVREEDGLAMSSRNKYLGKEERREALRLHNSLLEAKKLISGGERNSLNIKRAMENILKGRSLKVDYVSIAKYADLEEVDIVEDRTIIAVAAFLGRTRLIDNLIVEINENGPVFRI
jgi:pantoate--beta-alanine ligase